MPSTDTAAAEERLANYAEALRHRRLGRRVLWLHLSRHHDLDEARDAVPTALKILRPIVERRPGEIFVLRNGDVVMVAEGIAPEDLQGLRHRIGFLVGETQGEMLISTFDLLAEYDRFQMMVGRAVGKASAPVPEDRYLRTTGDRVLLPNAKALDDTARQPLKTASAAAPDIHTPSGPRPFSEIAEISKLVAAYTDDSPRLVARHVALRGHSVDDAFLRDPNLPISEGMLTQAHLQAERALLTALASYAPTWPVRGWLRLSDKAVLSPEFLSLTQRLESSKRPVVVLSGDGEEGLGIGEEERAYALKFLAELGIEIGIAAGALSELAHLGEMPVAKYVEVSIAPSDLNHADAVRAELAAIIRRIGRGRVVLADVADQHMLRFGQGVGIVMFRGRHIDQMVARAAA